MHQLIIGTPVIYPLRHHTDKTVISDSPSRLPQRDEQGFTLIELLVVIVIIAVLAAIAIPTYLAQRNKAWRVAAVADIKNAATAVETYAVENSGSFAGIDGADQTSPLLRGEGFNPSQWVSFSVSATSASYCIQGVNTHLPGRQLVFRSTTGVVDIRPGGGTPCAGP